jgi:hypothetical protein
MKRGSAGSKSGQHRPRPAPSAGAELNPAGQVSGILANWRFFSALKIRRFEGMNFLKYFTTRLEKRVQDTGARL